VQLYVRSPHYDFMAWCFVKHRDSFTFNFTFLLLSCHNVGKPKIKALDLKDLSVFCSITQVLYEEELLEEKSVIFVLNFMECTRVYPEYSGLAA
jgi:hypothetical protein